MARTQTRCKYSRYGLLSSHDTNTSMYVVPFKTLECGSDRHGRCAIHKIYNGMAEMQVMQDVYMDVNGRNCLEHNFQQLPAMPQTVCLFDHASVRPLGIGPVV